MLNRQLAKLSAILDRFLTGVAKTTSFSIGVEGGGGGEHEIVGKCYISKTAKWHLLVPFSAPHITQNS